MRLEKFDFYLTVVWTFSIAIFSGIGIVVTVLWALNI